MAARRRTPRSIHATGMRQLSCQCRLCFTVKRSRSRRTDSSTVLRLPAIMCINFAEVEARTKSGSLFRAEDGRRGYQALQLPGQILELGFCIGEFASGGHATNLRGVIPISLRSRFCFRHHRWRHVLSIERKTVAPDLGSFMATRGRSDATKHAAGCRTLV